MVLFSMNYAEMSINRRINGASRTKEPWSDYEDNLIMLMRAYKYLNKDISLILDRSNTSVKARYLMLLKIASSPLT